MLGQTLYRFLVPQSLMVFSVAIAMLLDPSPNIPQSVLIHLQAPISLKSGVFALLVGGTLPFALGFIIASISTFIMRVAACCLKKAKGFSTSWREEAQTELRKSYNFRDFRDESEQVETLMLSEININNLTMWLQRRWEYYILSINTSAGLGLAIVLIIFRINPGWLWYAGVTITIGILIFNSRQAWLEVTDMDNFLVRNLQKIRCRNNSSNQGERESNGEEIGAS